MVVFREFLISYYYIVNHFLNFIIIMKGFCLQWKIQKIYTVIDCRYISGAITPLAHSGWQKICIRCQNVFEKSTKIFSMLTV